MLQRMGLACAVLAYMIIPGLLGHSAFRENIPNGDRVPHPCRDGTVWPGVGHFISEGSGARNQFGIDLLNSSLVWTRELCQKDSDGDGRANGDELGDPGCKWERGSKPTTSEGLSHPGICEPVDSPYCRSKNERFGLNLNCSSRKDGCPIIKRSDIQKQHTRLPLTQVPAEMTNYICMLFDLPSDGDYHLVATTPLVNNSNMVHHMILFGCTIPDSEGVQRKVDASKNKPYKCGMSPHQLCQQIIGTWTIGSSGDCMSNNSGFRIGHHGYRVAALQVHWNNPNKMADQTDSSGMTLYYTANHGPYDAAVFVVGQEYLAIPPRASNTVFESTCPSDCTEQMFTQNVYLTRAVNHMHYLGRSQVVSLYRNGKKVRDLTNDQRYNYDSPIFYHYDPPVVLKPGDEIRTRCTYNSNSSKPTYFGAGTNDEMCYAFLTYYPNHQLAPTLCASWKTVQRCRRYLPKFGGMIGNCRWRSLLDPGDDEHKRVIADYFAEDNCKTFVKSDQCSTNCTQASKMLAKHPCFQGDIGDWVQYKMRTTPEGSPFMKTMTTCGAFINQAETVKAYKSSVVSGVISVFILVLVLL